MQGSNHVVWRRERASAFNRARFGRRLFSAQVPRRPFRLWASQRGRQGRLRHGALRAPSVSSSMSLWARSARVVVSVRTVKCEVWTCFAFCCRCSKCARRRRRDRATSTPWRCSRRCAISRDVNFYDARLRASWLDARTLEFVLCTLYLLLSFHMQ